jgi:hypothetical protein
MLVPLRDAPPAAVIYMPHPRPCMAALCPVPAAAVAVWLWGGSLTVQEVCLGHKDLMQSLDQPCAFAPLDSLPPLTTLAAIVQREHEERLMRDAAARARVYTGPMWQQRHWNTSNVQFTWVSM